jgi:hypothetical protein
MTFKDDFHQACVEAGGTWGENADDGSFFCSIPNDGQIKCQGESCAYIPHFETHHGVVVSSTTGGVGLSIALSPGGSTGMTIDLTSTGIEEILNSIRPDSG